MYKHPVESLTKIRRLIALFIFGLVISGLTAIPIESQLQIANDQLKNSSFCIPLSQWLNLVYQGIHNTNQRYPFIAYGTDWLAFAHFIIALVFIGPLREPIRNIWVIEFGLIACICIFPFAFIVGSIRGIPIFWQLLDCSFGVIGGLILLNCYKRIKALANLEAINHES